MEKNECYFLGFVTRTFGIKGEVSVVLDVDNPDKYKNLEWFYAEINNQLVKYNIQSCGIKKNTATIKLEGIDSIEKAEVLVRSEIYLPLSFLPPLEEKNFYIHEVINFEVIDEKYGKVGVLENILDIMPGQKIMQIKNGKNEILVPLKNEFISRVDRANKTITINTPEGLIDIYLPK